MKISENQRKNVFFYSKMMVSSNSRPKIHSEMDSDTFQTHWSNIPKIIEIFQIFRTPHEEICTALVGM